MTVAGKATRPTGPSDPSNAAVRGAGVCVLCSCNTCLGAAAATRSLRVGVRVRALDESALRRRVPRHGDRAQSLKPAKSMLRTIFKAFKKSNTLI